MKDDSVYLRHILEEIANIRAFTVAGESAFKGDRKTQHAVVMRNRLIHDYFGVDIDIVWRVVEHDLGPLEQRINQILDHGA